MNRKIFLSILIIAFSCTIFSKNQIDSVALAQRARTIEKINILLDSIKKINNDIIRLTINSEASKSIELLLKSSDSFNDTFKTVKNIGKIFSPDKAFNIITWNIPLVDGHNIFFGFIQMNPAKDTICKLFWLNDISNSLVDVNLSGEYSPDKWLGALYYEIITETVNRETIYILMGSMLNDMQTNRKIIETFYFKNKTEPTFGTPVIEYEKKIQNRIIFEYAIAISMTLRYNKKMKMIVFDHLSPSLPMYKGDYKFYGPDFSYDGLKFEKNRWLFVPNINVY